MIKQNVNTQAKVIQAIALYLEFFFRTVSTKDIRNSELFSQNEQLPLFDHPIILEPQRACLFFIDNLVHLRVHQSVLLASLDNEYIDNIDIPTEFKVSVKVKSHFEEVSVFYQRQKLWFILNGDVFNQLLKSEC